jgi:EAL domain-containing protein (putative c-di-GMP-specific phosphodiesterase class I)
MSKIHDSDTDLRATAIQPNWYLEGYTDERGGLRRFPIRPLPFQVGRKSDLPLPLNFANISRFHAELYFDCGQLIVRDLASRNGTFVNRQRISAPTVLQAGDVVHFGAAEFRVDVELDESGYFSDTCEFQGVLPEQFAVGTREFLEMVRRKAVVPHFQPLVRLETREVFAFELLGRGGMEGVPTSAGELFALAASCSMEGELSRLFRLTGLQACTGLQNAQELFVNVHPGETRNLTELGNLLGELRAEFPHLRITVEIHESLVTNPAAMLQFRARLSELSMKLAYDDFGAGQARLMELAEAPPDYLKFDRALVTGIHTAPKQRKQMVELLVKYAKGIGVITLAEGIETAEEARMCLELGFTCGQGFYFGKPSPILVDTLTPTQF